MSCVPMTARLKPPEPRKRKRESAYPAEAANVVASSVATEQMMRLFLK